MIRYIFNEEIQVLEVTYEGVVNAEDIIKHSRYISENNKLPRKLKILTDARNADYNFNPDSVYKLVGLLQKNLEKYEYIKNAFIHSKPKETAYSLLLEIQQKYHNYYHKIFASKKAALCWLK